MSTVSLIPKPDDHSVKYCTRSSLTKGMIPTRNQLGKIKNSDQIKEIVNNFFTSLCGHHSPRMQAAATVKKNADGKIYLGATTRPKIINGKAKPTPDKNNINI